MPSPAIIDIDSIIAPISDDNPTGSDIRQDPSPTSIYNKVKDARSAARAAERHSMFDEDNSAAMDHWYKILDLAPEILRDHSKDLEVASWYAEALIRRAGFQGLRDAFTIIHQLIEKYWDNLYPMPDEEDGLEARVSSLTGLNGEGAEGVLIAPIRNVTITEGTDPGPFSLWQYKQALEIHKIADDETRSKKAAKIGYTVEDIENAVTNSSETFFVNLRDDISQAIDAYRQASRLLDQHCGSHDAPPTSNIINTLDDALSIIKHVARFKLPPEVSAEQPVAMDADGVVMQDGASGAVAVLGGPIKSRQDAFRHLTTIADFFRKTEPHSPISYIIDKAVRWGDMDLNELIKELIPDSSSRGYYGSLTGVRTDDD